MPDDGKRGSLHLCLVSGTYGVAGRGGNRPTHPLLTLTLLSRRRFLIMDACGVCWGKEEEEEGKCVWCLGEGERDGIGGGGGPIQSLGWSSSSSVAPEGHHAISPGSEIRRSMAEAIKCLMLVLDHWQICTVVLVSCNGGSRGLRPLFHWSANVWPKYLAAK